MRMINCRTRSFRVLWHVHQISLARFASESDSKRRTRVRWTTRCCRHFTCKRNAEFWRLYRSRVTQSCSLVVNSEYWIFVTVVRHYVDVVSRLYDRLLLRVLSHVIVVIFKKIVYFYLFSSSGTNKNTATVHELVQLESRDVNRLLLPGLHRGYVCDR